MKTTLNQIREHRPCVHGWETLLKHLGKTKADDDELSILTILDSNGIDDALWCLRAVEGHDIVKRRFAVFCVKQVEHLLTDSRSLDAIAVAERWCDSQATDDELQAAGAAAYAAAYVARADAAAAADAAAYAADADAADGAHAAAAAAAYAYAGAGAAAYAAWRVAQADELRRISEVNQSFCHVQRGGG